MKKIIKINKKRAYSTYDMLLYLYDNKKHPFENPVVPQAPENLPHTLIYGSRQHALYLFYICLYMRGRINSFQAFTGFKKLYLSHPQIFEPHIVNANPAEYYNIILNALRSTGNLAVNAANNATFWIKNSKELDQGCWGNDPRNIFNYVNLRNRNKPEAYNLLCSNIIRKSTKKDFGFYGFREKMVSMLCYFYVESGIIPHFLFPSPIDFHILRIHCNQEIIKVAEIKTRGVVRDMLLPACRQLTASYCKEKKINPVKLADILWLFSQYTCRENPNSDRSKIKPDEKGNKKRDRQSEIEISNVIWTKNNIYKYHNSCAICPLNVHCQGHVSSVPYYSSGKIRIIRNQAPDDQLLFPIAKRSKKTNINKKNIQKKLPTPNLNFSIFDQK
ncbi:MAG TPA: hypothetical protein PK720_00385 [bacterium]|nr:hypothetical protein [bacterium]